MVWLKRYLRNFKPGEGLIAMGITLCVMAVVAAVVSLVWAVG